MGLPRCLAHREVAAYLVSEVLGWNIVPHTWLRDGPLGVGMVQLWQNPDPEQTAVDLVPADEVSGTNWSQALESKDDSGRIGALVRQDWPALWRMAVAAVVVVNGQRYAADHGRIFHGENKVVNQ